MKAVDRSEEPWYQATLVLCWLIGSLLCFFLTSCFLDVGIILVWPLLGFVSSIALFALIVRGLRRGWAERDRGWYSAATATCGFVAIPIVIALFSPVVWAGGYVQAQAVLAFHLSDYEREIGRASRRGARAEPILWSYGGWLSIDRDIVFYRNGDPATRLITKLGASSADCRWLRDHFYDCTIDY